MSLLLFCLYFYLPKFVPAKQHVRSVPSQTQSIWLGRGGRDPSMKLDNSKAPVFSTVTCSLELLQGRLLMGMPLHLPKTLSGEWIQIHTT